MISVNRTLMTMTGLLVAVSFAGCGGSTSSNGPTEPPIATSPTGSEAPSDVATEQEMVVVRSGGIAGFFDTVRIAADGTAQLTRRTGETYACTPDPAALARLRAIDLAAVGSGMPKSPIADGFTYSVSSASDSATAGDGDTQGIRAELRAAAAAVVTSCVESPPER